MLLLVLHRLLGAGPFAQVFRRTLVCKIGIRSGTVMQSFQLGFQTSKCRRRAFWTVTFCGGDAKHRVYTFADTISGKCSQHTSESVVKVSYRIYIRHSAHPLKQGTDLRLIQSLLGLSDKSTKTLTHFTAHGFDKIKSPLGSVDL